MGTEKVTFAGHGPPPRLQGRFLACSMCLRTSGRAVIAQSNKGACGWMCRQTASLQCPSCLCSDVFLAVSCCSEVLQPTLAVCRPGAATCNTDRVRVESVSQYACGRYN